MHILKTSANPVETESMGRMHMLTKAEPRQTENTESEMLFIALRLNLENSDMSIKE